MNIRNIGPPGAQIADIELLFFEPVPRRLGAFDISLGYDGLKVAFPGYRQVMDLVLLHKGRGCFDGSIYIDVVGKWRHQRCQSGHMMNIPYFRHGLNIPW